MEGSDPLAPSQLFTWERGLLVAGLTRAGVGLLDLLQGLSQPGRSRLAAAAASLLALPRPRRAAALAREAGRLFGPVPPGLEAVDASWLRRPLEELPPVARAAYCAAFPDAPRPLSQPQDEATAALPAPVLTWVARRTCAALRGMPPTRPGAPTTPAALVRCPVPVLEEELLRLGHARVAAALRAAPQAATAAFCARLEPAEARALRGAVARAPDDHPAAREAAADVAQVMQRGVTPAALRDLLQRVGARVLGRAVAGQGDLPHQLAQRLPRAIGCVLLEAAAGHEQASCSEEP